MPKQHNKVTFDTTLKAGDSIFYHNRWQEIYHIDEDMGLNLSHSGWTCRSKIEICENHQKKEWTDKERLEIAEKIVAKMIGYNKDPEMYGDLERLYFLTHVKREFLEANRDKYPEANV